MSTPEPGLDLHEWQTERESLQEQLEESPEEALPDLAGLVGRMLDARAAGDDPELRERYDPACETARRAEGGDADPGDVADAINSLSELFDTLVVQQGAP